MVAYRMIFLAGAAAALPLNINLGAYSPALVVGDGEISFGGNQDVSNLMSVLEGAAVNAANGAAAGAAAGQAQAPAVAPAAAAPAAAAQPAAVAAAPAAVAPTSEAAAVADPALTEQAQQIAALQGMGKEIAPRVEPSTPESVAKRDLASFDRALKFAEAALVKGPKVQLGTGEGGSGVGMIVDNNQVAAARTGTGSAEGGAAEGAAAAAKAKTTKRDLSSPRLKVTTMYVRSGIPASLQNGGKMTARDLEARDLNIPVTFSTPAVFKREATTGSSTALDAVNLNVDGDQGITMTFVETVEDADDE